MLACLDHFAKENDGNRDTSQNIKHLIVLLFMSKGGNFKNYRFTCFFERCTVVCLFVLRLNVPVNNFSVMSGRSRRFLGLTSTAVS